MLTNIQIKAEGPRAQDVDVELRQAARLIGETLENEIQYTDQFIEGRPGDPSPSAFKGRLSIKVVGAPKEALEAVAVNG